MNSRNAVALFVLVSLLISIPIQARAQDSSVVVVRKVLTRVDPQYPSLARNLNIRGNVRVEVLVAPNGTVKSLELKGGHPLLADVSQNAVRQWKWEPSAHETHETVEFKFNP
jgi:TonB family protein